MFARTPLIIKLIAIMQFLFVTGYFIYYIYIGSQWGFTERIILDLISDSVYLLLILSSVGLLLKKGWSWWLTIVIYSMYLIANSITALVVALNIVTGMIAENLQLNLFIIDIILLLLFLTVIIILSRRSVRELFNVGFKGSKLLFLVVISSIILYMLYFIIMLLSITWLL